MKATLKYDLPDEEEDFEAAINGPAYKEIVMSIRFWLENTRDFLGHSSVSVSEILHRMETLAKNNSVEWRHD